MSDDTEMADLADRVSKIRPYIKDSFSLCEFMKKSEREYMVAETICAAAINMADHGEPFSFRGNGVFSRDGNGLFDNGTAYGYLMGNGYFREDDRCGRVVIFPTTKLLDSLEAFFKIAKRPAEAKS